MNTAPSLQRESFNCDTHGAYEPIWNRFAGEWLICPRCQAERAAEEERKQREHQRLEQVRQYIADAGTPPKFARARFEDAPQKMRGWAEQVIAGTAAGPLIVVGPVGTGKSHASCAAVRHVIAATARRGLYTTAAGYGRMVRDTWGRNSEHSESQLLREFSRAPFLVMDEFGASREVDAPLLQDLVCVRYDAGLLPRTIFISNLAVAKFDGAAGERVADRLREGATLLIMDGKSRRKPAA